MATSVPLQWQKQFSTAKAADAWLADQIASRTKTTRRQRHDLLLPRVGGLRSVAASRKDHGAAAGDQLGRRFRQSAGAADDGDADQEGEARAHSSCCQSPTRRAGTARTRCPPCGGSSWRRSSRRCAGETAPDDILRGRAGQPAPTMRPCRSAAVAVLAAVGSLLPDNASHRRAATRTPARAGRARPIRTIGRRSRRACVLHGGKLYESTGLVGQSSLREVEIETGRVIRRTTCRRPSSPRAWRWSATG